MARCACVLPASNRGSFMHKTKVLTTTCRATTAQNNRWFWDCILANKRPLLASAQYCLLATKSCSSCNYMEEGQTNRNHKAENHQNHAPCDQILRIHTHANICLNLDQSTLSLISLNRPFAHHVRFGALLRSTIQHFAHRRVVSQWIAHLCKYYLDLHWS